MSRLLRREQAKGASTGVSHAFLDRFLPEANGEFVKLYLLLLRKVSEDLSEITVSELADGLNVTEGDVMRALRYWEKKGQLSLGFTGMGSLASIELTGDEPERQAAETKPEEMPVEGARSEAGFPPALSLNEDEEFVQLLYVIQKYLGKVLTGRDLDMLAYWYQELCFPADVIEYMVEDCVNNGHRSMRYIEKVALDWHERGFKTLARAKAYSQSYRNEYYKIMKAFGLGGRNPAPPEQEAIEKWLSKYRFPVDIITEACRRTIETIHEPSFKYADRILSDWKDAGVHTKEDIEKLDERRKKGRSVPAPRTSAAAASRNRFHNFEQRTYDYDALLKKLNQQGGGKPSCP
ncbi:MAG: DnaD domain protein [Lachnospiraceae bacterium]|nr:DnaD domain protein [Lachnospiraceae bacterium]